MSKHVHRDHNVSVLLYRIVCPAKDRRALFSAEVDATRREVCLEVAVRHEITSLDIGTDREDHVHFLVQTIPTYSATKLDRVLKSLTAREEFRRGPAVTKYLRGGEFWSDGSHLSTVGRHSSKGEIRRYIARQGRRQEYSQLHTQQLRLL